MRKTTAEISNEEVENFLATRRYEDAVRSSIRYGFEAQLADRLVLTERRPCCYCDFEFSPLEADTESRELPCCPSCLAI
jgi:hypothetical protein